MIDRTHALPITKQATALGISRGSVYYTPRPVPVFEETLMRRTDAVHLELPWFGARGLRRVFKREYPGVGRRRIGTLMRHMGIAAVASQPGTSKRHGAHPVYPYLLRLRTITRQNAVWAMGITYSQLPCGMTDDRSTKRASLRCRQNRLCTFRARDSSVFQQTRVRSSP